MIAAGANLAIQATTVEIVQALANAGVRSITLKGPLLTRELYADNAARSSTDVDLLVPPGAFETAEALFSKMAYELLSHPIPHDRPLNAHSWRTPRGIHIDLHRNLIGMRATAEEVWQVLSMETETVILDDGQVEVLARGACALHVALHAAQHGIRYSKALADLEQALKVLPTPSWRRAAELAIRLDAVAAFSAGLKLLPAGSEILGQLALPNALTVEAALLASSPPQTARGFEWLAHVRGPRSKMSLVLRKFFPPAAWLRSCSPVASRGRIGLAAAYCWRVLWLLFHAGPGLLAWLRARRRIRGPG